MGWPTVGSGDATAIAEGRWDREVVDCKCELKFQLMAVQVEVLE